MYVCLCVCVSVFVSVSVSVFVFVSVSVSVWLCLYQGLSQFGHDCAHGIQRVNVESWSLFILRLPCQISWHTMQNMITFMESVHVIMLGCV